MGSALDSRLCSPGSSPGWGHCLVIVIPDVMWEDVRALKDVWEELMMAILVHFMYSYLKYYSGNTL